MNELAISGRNWTIRVFASILLISIYTIVTYNIVVDNVESKKIIQQSVRFTLTVLLMYFVLKGKSWAVMFATLLFSIGAIGGLVSLFNDFSLVEKLSLATMTTIYSIAVYHLNFSEGFKEYLKHQNAKP